MAGRKPKYATAKALEQAVDAYFASISYQEPAVVATPTGEVDEQGRIKYKTMMLTRGHGDLSSPKRGEPVTVTKWLRPPSMAGLCLHLGISKETWSNYAGQEKLRAVVERTRARMEDYWTERLDGKGANGARFALSSCYGWSGEKREVELGPRAEKAVGAATMPMSERKALLEQLAREFAGAEGGAADEAGTDR